MKSSSFNNNVPLINIDDFNYALSPGRIAQHPLAERHDSKLLVCRNGSLTSDVFRNIAIHLPPGSTMVFNNTRVIRARLLFRKTNGSLVEIFCLEPLKPTRETGKAFTETGQVTWKCLIGNARRWKSGSLEKGTGDGKHSIILTASMAEEFKDGTFAIIFSWNSDCTFGEVLERTGNIPLPPYINREEIPDDATRYQTIYAMEKGSVAAPTAGLHFTPPVLESLRKKQIRTSFLTLHVGLGTFRPVTTTDISLHHMHEEKFVVERETLSQLIVAVEKQIIAVGTTSVRALESLYWLGIRVIDSGGTIPRGVGQWDNFNLLSGTGTSGREALEALLATMDRLGLSRISACTSLMIVPGYRFRIVSGMITNFHQPRSTLLLLVASYLGERWQEVYSYAMEHDFRFLSYGDTCLFLNDQ